MTPEVYYLELHIAQVANEMSLINDKVKDGLYENKKLIEYINTLNDIVTELLKCDLESKSENDKEQIRYILIYISSCIQYIKSATVNDLNAALYICLRAALEDWAKDPANTYVMSSYKAEVGTHHFYGGTVAGQVIKSVKDIFGITIPSKLVSLGYPSHLEKDFISNVSLYHELGHFIDMCDWRISLSLRNFIITNKCLPMPDTYFKNIDTAILYGPTNKRWEDERNKLTSMLQEYFADIFAVQYVGRHKHHLTHYMFGGNDFTADHPSTEARTMAINNFLGPSASHDGFINMLKWATNAITGKELKVRNVDIDIAPLLSDNPCTVTNKNQLHTLFHKAWEIWESNLGGYRKTPDTISAYNKMNKLLEDSIMNYANSR